MAKQNWRLKYESTKRLYDRIEILVAKGEREKLKKTASYLGYDSLNAYIKSKLGLS